MVTKLRTRWPLKKASPHHYVTHFFCRTLTAFQVKWWQPAFFYLVWQKSWSWPFAEASAQVVASILSAPTPCCFPQKVNEMPIISNLPAALSWISFYALRPSEAWTKIILLSLFALMHTSSPPVFPTTPHNLKKKSIPQWKRNKDKHLQGAVLNVLPAFNMPSHHPPFQISP